MLNIKKISPTEFRLHNKLFYIAYTPNNYFEAQRFEIIFQYLLIWFFKELGIYFYIQKLKIIDDHVLFQIYYYRTYLYPRKIDRAIITKESGEPTETYLEYPELIQDSVYLHFYNRGLLDNFAKRSVAKKRATVFNSSKSSWQLKIVRIRKPIVQTKKVEEAAILIEDLPQNTNNMKYIDAQFTVTVVKPKKQKHQVKHKKIKTNKLVSKKIVQIKTPILKKEKIKIVELPVQNVVQISQLDPSELKKLQIELIEAENEVKKLNVSSDEWNKKRIDLHQVYVINRQSKEKKEIYGKNHPEWKAKSDAVVKAFGEIFELKQAANKKIENLKNQLQLPKQNIVDENKQKLTVDENKQTLQPLSGKALLDSQLIEANAKLSSIAKENDEIQDKFNNLENQTYSWVEKKALNQRLAKNLKAKTDAEFIKNWVTNKLTKINKFNTNWKKKSSAQHQYNKKKWKNKGKKKFIPHWLKERIKRNKLIAKNFKQTLKTRPCVSFNFFFTYFFLHFFKYSSIILYKSLYKLVLSNQPFKLEHSTLLYRTRYLQKTYWIYDLYFFINYALTFSNTTFIFPFFVYHLTTIFKQRKEIVNLFNILRVLYYYKRNIRGIKILVNGPYDRHGRSRHLILKIGDISLTEYKSYIMYDAIQCPTLYGTIHLKLWVHYTEVDAPYNLDKIIVAIPPSRNPGIIK